VKRTSKVDYMNELRAKERGDLIRLRHGVYAAPEALLNTMIDVERIIPNGVYACTMPGHIINCLRQSRLLFA